MAICPIVVNDKVQYHCQPLEVLRPQTSEQVTIKKKDHFKCFQIQNSDYVFSTDVFIAYDASKSNLENVPANKCLTAPNSFIVSRPIKDKVFEK